ncbi:D-alanyl-lipoteichoic acid acyltransferase DltB, MBOAT superfamily [Cohaesibacter sp. ES.047]|uniref:MBOAT family O-acyltransferase n=1 Tax=Cohaesibacter sp. ES.047 TaxID=1798205 RepID=UPI000BB97643|nr:MBOAT family protein [Cohaesibacter sp. ES.047]SNY93233.1 D-alanyl-lipoteichoic acid acyltransferase DltB, MBOAT superfamily [Cohaesibacter sp. ES.047]
MLFPTVDFGIFFLVVFFASWLLRERAENRKHLLLIASYFFYGYWDWAFCFLLLFNALVSYIGGLWIDGSDQARRRKIILALVVTIDLGLLGYFKYAGFFMESLRELFFRIGLERDLPILEIILPVGISFFTFQSISYVVDVYRREIPATRSFSDLALYISFFPQLVAGPIVRAAHFMPQLDATPVLTRLMMSKGLFLILIGMLKKMVLANYLATLYVDNIFVAPEMASSFELVMAVYAYAAQIYCDFSGYSDIAIGIAALLGYHFKRNFNQPYRSASLQEFWTRWHISLSQWLRDYLYIPLGGSKHGPLKTYRNLFLTMFLGGLWHGAAMTFVIWGTIHGLALIIERLLGIRRWVDKGAGRIIGVLVTFHIVCLAWIFFRASSLELALAYLQGITFGTTDIFQFTPFIAGLILVCAIGQFMPERSYERCYWALSKTGTLGMMVIFTLGMVAIQQIAPFGTAPFIYFQF